MAYPDCDGEYGQGTEGEMEGVRGRFGFASSGLDGG